MIYLDNNATTRVWPEVVHIMLPFYGELWGNPSSLHRFGAQVATHIEQARQNVADLLGAERSSEIIFTGSGSESNNLAIRGLLPATPQKRHIITTKVEHSSVLRLCEALEKENYSVTYLDVDREGKLPLENLEKAIRADTALVSIMWANNETGVIFPIPAIAKICREREVPLHVDAVQAAGKIPIDIRRLPGLTLLSISGHKLHAPKGIGALYVRRGTSLTAMILGGGQEKKLRSGTENVPSIVGLGAACRLAKEHLNDGTPQKIASLRDSFEQGLSERLGTGVVRNGSASERVPNTSNLSFVGCEGETICLLLSEEGIAASTGSACSQGNMTPSRILTAMGKTLQEAKGAVRFSLSLETTKEEIDQTLSVLGKIISRLKR